MGDESTSPELSSGPFLVGRVLKSTATGAVATLLFVVISALWIVAAATARVWYHSAPPGYEFPRRSGLYVWVVLAAVGALLAFGSLLQCVWPVLRRQPLVVIVACVGAAAEIVLVHLVTGHAMATAPLGFDDSGEGAAAIVALGVSQPVLVGALALILGRLPTAGRRRVARDRQRSSWSYVGSLVGMVIACGALAAWSLYDRTAFVVDTSLIAGKSAVTNVGAWWPGLFAAVVALMVAGVVSVPAVVRKPALGPSPRRRR
jgi:hypothetical protein